MKEFFLFIDILNIFELWLYGITYCYIPLRKRKKKIGCHDFHIKIWDLLHETIPDRVSTRNNGTGPPDNMH